MKYSIVIPTYNHLEDCLKPCCESILKFTDFSKDDTEIIIVANGCTDGTKDYVNSLGKHFKLVWIDEPSGYTKSTNVGIKVATGEYIVLLNNDTILLEQYKNAWLDLLVEPFLKNPKVGATGPLSLYDNYAQEKVLIFFCVMIKNAVFNTVGLLDEVFSPGGGEDIDFTVKLLKAGYEWKQVPHNELGFTFTNTGDFPIYHKGEGTFDDMPEYSLSFIKKNGLVNCKRYSKNIKLKLNSLEWQQDQGYLTVHPHRSSHLDMPYDKMDFDDNTVYHLIAVDVLESADNDYKASLAKEWYRILRKDGIVTIEQNGKRTDYSRDEVLRLVEGNYKSSKVYDCFPFFNELDVLEIRLNTLNDVVDYFVISEMQLTHSGNKKPLYLSKALFDYPADERFKKFKDKIIYICPLESEIPKSTDDKIESSWIKERFQRQLLERGLANCTNNDFIIISDLDEIPNPDKIKNYKENKLSAFQHRRFNYYLNLDNGLEEQVSGIGAKILPFSMFKQINDPLSLCYIRYQDCKNSLITDGGWHFSYMGGPKNIVSKIESWAHQEWNKEEHKNLDKIKAGIEKGIDPIFGKQLNFIPIDNTFPKWVVDNKEILVKKGLIKNVDPIEVTAYISTKNRYFTTLPMAILAIINQTYKVKQLIIFDDAEEKDRKDLRNLAPYKELFSLISAKGIAWYVYFGEGKGQALNHQKVIDLKHSTEWLWRVDDDDTPEPNCLEQLVSNITDEVGAIGGSVIMPSTPPMDINLCSGKIEDIFRLGNVQWAKFDKTIEVDHLHNTFLYRKSASKHGYCLQLSPVGHREETLFSYEMKRNNWKLLVDGRALTWHLKDPNGGIRSYDNLQLWEHDENIFKQKMRDWNVSFDKSDKNLIVLNCGLGDHLIFKNIINEIKVKYGPELKLAVCFPEVFEDDNVKLISIAEAELLDSNHDKYNIYKWCWDRNWSKSLLEAFKEMYLYETEKKLKQQEFVNILNNGSITIKNGKK